MPQRTVHRDETAGLLDRTVHHRQPEADEPLGMMYRSIEQSPDIDSGEPRPQHVGRDVAPGVGQCIDTDIGTDIGSAMTLRSRA